MINKSEYINFLNELKGTQTTDKEEIINGIIDFIKYSHDNNEIKTAAVELMKHQGNYIDDLNHYFSKGIQTLMIDLNKREE